MMARVGVDEMSAGYATTLECKETRNTIEMLILLCALPAIVVLTSVLSARHSRVELR